MRILHTSDWHIGRTFHGNQTLDALGEVLRALVGQVREHAVDVVIVAGDVFDSATPAAACYTLLTETLAEIRDAGARVIVTSGNHDSAARLGFQSRLLRDGIHVLTDPLALDRPIVVDDADGPVRIYGIPFLEPTLVRHLWEGVELRTQAQTLAHAMDLVRTDLAAAGGRSVVVSHCFAAGVEPTPHLERDIQQGGLDIVPLSVFDGVDYVALGHIHGRQELAPHIRYAGAPLHYSFGEQRKPRGSWLVELDATGFVRAEWLDLPVPRPLTTLRDTLDALLSDEAYAGDEQSWVCAEYTDAAAQPDVMRRLQERFPHCAMVRHVPALRRESDGLTYARRVGRARSDLELVDGFLAHVRGTGATEDERAVLVEVLAEVSASESGSRATEVRA